ncbi:sentrin-specific protease 7b [Eucyclogobius newberryi]|uniref:sentrin-specific protease 7b n=1 Tax=Eucyclogobius newberryi TaxID=166745 RepID=UPI003B5A6989
MTTPFKIPKRAPSDSGSVQMTSPLSRLQRPTDQFESVSLAKDQTLSGNSSNLHSETNSLKMDLKSRIGHKTTEPFSNGWRPKRASDRILAPVTSASSPNVKNDKSVDSPLENSLSDACTLRPIAVRSLDALAALRGERHRGSSPVDQRCPRTLETPNKEKSNFSWSKVNSAPSSPVPSTAASDKTPSGPKVQSGWSELSDVREKQREKWRQFKEKKQNRTHASIRTQRNQDQNQTRTSTTASSEPIILSSEEEEEEEEEEQSDVSRSNQSKQQTQVVPSLPLLSGPPPSFLQLDFCSFHVGLSRAEANGKITITESGITIPVKGPSSGSSLSPGPGSSAELCVVASQIRAFGLWDGGVASGGSLFSDTTHSPSGPAPSLLFLWITDAQSKLLQAELRELQLQRTDLVCCFVLLVLKKQLLDLDSALVLSVLDSGDYRKSRSESASGPLDWSQGLVLIHTSPSPLDSHLLRLLGQKETKENQSCAVRSTRSQLRSGATQLSSRLIQYPAAPSKGRISVSSDDLLCLNQGEFLNDVIIDFYLKYLLLEGVGGTVAEKSHVFSSFFYKQLSKRRAAGEDDITSVPDCHMRHQRVRTWTRNVDIFTKDFLFVPVNQEAHWFLVVVCFPGLEELKHEDFSPCSDTVRPGFGLRSQTPPECTMKGCRKNRVLKRPCLLVMDSLKLSYHETVCRLLRDYLQVEWVVRRGSRRLFSSDSVKSCNCRVPQQDNSSDCGVYLLQNAQSFLQNPVVNFDLPVRLETWFPRQQVRNKRDEIRSLVLRLHQDQG